MQCDLALGDGRSAHLRLSDALTLSFGPDLVYTFDLAGRPIGAYRQGRNLRRGLDGRVLARWRVGRGPRQRAWLSHAETEAMLAAMRQDLALAAAASPPAPAGEVVARAIGFDAATDVAAFHHIYLPVPILPPDQYQALVLQATEGCSFNTCTFCALYRDRPFRIKRPAEFQVHIEAVKAFFGTGLRLRRSIFLADANALIAPQPLLLPLFDAVANAFPILPLGLNGIRRRRWLDAHPQGVSGLYAFVDGLSAERKDDRDWKALRDRGLRRVYIGLESGHEPLLAWLRKPSTAAAMLDAVQHMKAAGLAVGVIVLTGVGGQRYHEGHCADTAAVLNAMPLDAADIIYFSPFRADEAAPYAAVAAAAGIEPATAELAHQQQRDIQRRLTLAPPPAGPRRAPYDLREFVY